MTAYVVCLLHAVSVYSHPVLTWIPGAKRQVSTQDVEM